MADVINFNRARKERQRAEEKRQAAANRVKFGRTKGEKQRDEEKSQRDDRDLDDKKLD